MDYCRHRCSCPRRPPGWWLALLLAAAAAAALAGPAVAAPDPFYGVYAEDAEFGEPDPAAAARRQARAGIGTVRVVLDWRVVGADPDEPLWLLSDRAVEGSSMAELDVLAVLLGAPAWATGAPAGAAGMRPPRHAGDFAAFAADAVRRYGPAGEFWSLRPDLPYRPVRVWQLWNEPNLPVFWWPAPDPPAYAELVVAAAAAIRAVDPGAEVVSAGIPNSPAGAPAHPFLAVFYAAGGTAVDSVGVHPYSIDAFGVLAEVEVVRRLADRSGAAHQQIRVTEFGWATGGLPSLLTVDEAGQAALVGESVALLRRAAERLRLRGIVYFKWRDNPRVPWAPDIWPYHAGLLNTDGTAKPALAAYSAAMTEPAPAGPQPVAPTPPTPVAGWRAAPLSVTLRAQRQRAARVRRRGLRIHARCNRPCSATITVVLERRGIRVTRTVAARGRRRLASAGWHAVRLRVNARDLRRALGPHGSLVVRASALDVAGSAAAARPRRIRLQASSAQVR